MKIGKHTTPLLFALCLLPVGFLFAGDLAIRAQLDKAQLSMSEQTILTVTVSASGLSIPDPKLPDMPEFQVYSAGRSQSFSMVNGQTSGSVTFNFVLTPRQEGKFSIPPIRVEGGGQVSETAPIPIEITKGTNAVPVPAPAASAQGAATHRVPGLLVTTAVDKASVYVGEQVTLAFRLYRRVDLLGNQYTPPPTQGLWSEDLPPQRNFQGNYKGVPYNINEIRTALFPTSAGKATIGPASLTVRVASFNDPFSSDFFNNFFAGGEDRTLRTDPITLTVKPLPDPKPAGFRGAVGRYSLRAALDKQTTTVGQPLTLTVTISGTGNIKSVPDLNWPEFTNFRTFDANAATNIEKKDGLVEGSKVFKTVLIPTTSGDLKIPAIPFVFFNPATRNYATLNTPALVVSVKPGSAASAGAAGSYTPAAAPGIHVLNEDIRYIRPYDRFNSQGAPLYRRVFVWALAVLAFVTLIGVLLWRGYGRLFLSDRERLRFRTARASALHRLDETEAALAQSDVRQAANLLSSALHGYFADKLGEEESALGRKEIIAHLQERGLPEHTAVKVRRLWENLDLFQYAPTQVKAEDVRLTDESLRQVIEELERLLKWNDR